MQTGSKTYTAVAQSYRFLKFGGAKRVLFLVDRGNLAEQTLGEFQDYVAPDTRRKFTEVYKVQWLRGNRIDPVAKVVVTTIQRLYSVRRGETEFDEALEQEGVGSWLRKLGRERWPLPTQSIECEDRTTTSKEPRKLRLGTPLRLANPSEEFRDVRPVRADTHNREWVTCACEMRPTMADIARETGLTLGTVSRALNTDGKYAISPETRGRVLATAARLGYRPNLIGKALAARSTGLILLVSPDPFAPYYVEISRRLSAQAARHGYSFVAGGALPEGDEIGIPANDWLYGVDGMVACDCLPHQEAYIAEAIRLRIPVVGLGVRDPFPTDFVKVDLHSAARELMAHLAASGCRRPAMLSSPGAEADDPRRRAYLEAVSAGGSGERFVMSRDQSRASAREAVVEAYGSGEFDGLFCENDLMAVGALRGLMDLGVSVPGRVRLAGCDGLEEARYQSVPITTIVQPLAPMCAAAWAMLQSRIEGEEGPVRFHESRAVLEIRASTA